MIVDWQCRDYQILQESAAGNRFTIIPVSAVTLGRVRFDVIDNKSSSGSQTDVGILSKSSRNRLHISGTVGYLCDSVFSLRPLRSGEVITEDDVKLVSHMVTDMVDCGIGDIKAVVGQEVARSIRSNQVLLPAMIKKITMIKRGDLVDVWSTSGSISISITGRAMSDGAYGDVISVRDERNKTVLRGKVTGASTVTITPAGAVVKSQSSVAGAEVSVVNDLMYATNKMAGTK